MRLQAQREACLNVIGAAHDLSERVYPALLEILRSDGPAETPPDFLKVEQAAIRAAVDRLELEGPTEVIPLAHEIIEAARGIDEDCMMEIPALESIYRISGGLVRISRLFNLSKELTAEFSEEITENIRNAIIDHDSDRIRTTLQPVVDRRYITAFQAHEIATCRWDYLVGVEGGIHHYLDDARMDFTKAAHTILAERQGSRRNWLIGRLSQSRGEHQSPRGRWTFRWRRPRTGASSGRPGA
ncbi:hypothetical protein [Streptomyces purpurascens]|uniref:hypothetical protein n=1 Tax=Streptomyces purpurascens TaxID=1924 RepID=UPI001676710C|nr:hypothetical protein [Streptomyces purpurascens]MCE7051325.1 hypothetical protein [Streptomyces purpurascens]